MDRQHSDKDNNQENTCVVCFKNVDTFSVGICDHPVCYECSTRMRVLCNQQECPICRGEMTKVIFTKNIEPYSVLNQKAEKLGIEHRKYGLYFMSPSIQRKYYSLLEHECSLCKKNGLNSLFKTFQQLKDHMRKHHELFYCDLCVANLRIFTFERKCYTRAELGTHRRKGDPDNRSHRGHPLCEFCDERFMDNDELFRHLRRDHLFCHFCDADGKHHYYNTYGDLRKHYVQEHYLCEEGDCKHEKFTSVFRTDIDLKAHYACVHGRNLSKAANRQARTLELEFTLAPRPRTDGTGRGRFLVGSRDRSGFEPEGAVGSYSVEPGGVRDDLITNPLADKNFPTLGGGEGMPRTVSNVTITSRMNPLSEDNFPTLGGGNNVAAGRSGVTITTTSGRYNNNTNNKLTKENFPTLGGRGVQPAVTITRTVKTEEKPGPSGATVRLSVNSNVQDGMSIHVNQNQISVRPKSEAFPALSQQMYPAPPQPQWVLQKSKKQQEAKASKVAPAPVLPSSSLNDFPSLSKREEAKKSSKSDSTSSSWVNLNKFNSKGKKTSAKPIEETPKTENLYGTEASEVNKTKKKQKPKELKKPNTNSDQEESIVKKVKEKNDANLPNGTNSETNPPAKKRSQLNIGALKINDEEDFPSLDPNHPPPGFNVKPPPGFTNNDYMSNFVNGDVGGVSNDLTFTNSSGQSYSIVPNRFYYPQNFKARNQTLIKKLMEITHDQQKIKEFKQRSDDFRKNVISAEQYYVHCNQFMGLQFEQIFYELLVLLPDLKKQQELYEIHVLFGGNIDTLVICAHCSQVVLRKELHSHSSNHTLDNHFPSLYHRSNELDNAWNRK